MNKALLIAKIAERSELTKKQAETALNTFIEVVADTLKEGEKVQLTGFGTFEVRERPAHVSRNPSTGEKIDVEAKRIPRFKIGKGFKDRF